MARRELGAGALTAPVPPVIVTVKSGGRVNALTIGWTGILATHPPKTYISVRPQRHSYEMLKHSGEFVINLARASQARVVDYIGIYTGAKRDKLADCGLSLVESVKVSAPTIAESPLALECRVSEVIPMGTHDVFVADIVGVTVDEEILDENGRLCLDRANLLAYAHGEYFALGEKLGAFGFSTKKGKSSEREKRCESPKERGEEKSEGEEGHRPFYLDAPKGGRRKRRR